VVRDFDLHRVCGGGVEVSVTAAERAITLHRRPAPARPSRPRQRDGSDPGDRLRSHPGRFRRPPVPTAARPSPAARRAQPISGLAGPHRAADVGRGRRIQPVRPSAGRLEHRRPVADPAVWRSGPEVGRRSGQTRHPADERSGRPGRMRGGSRRTAVTRVGRTRRWELGPQVVEDARVRRACAPAGVDRRGWR
jgi:hypothetical protein